MNWTWALTLFRDNIVSGWPETNHIPELHGEFFVRLVLYTPPFSTLKTKRKKKPGINHTYTLSIIYLMLKQMVKILQLFKSPNRWHFSKSLIYSFSKKILIVQQNIIRALSYQMIYIYIVWPNEHTCINY